MILACPHCSAVYELPKRLLGAGGAAVRCPHCSGEFTLGADGEIVAVLGSGARIKGGAEVVVTSARLRGGAAAAEVAAPSRAPDTGESGLPTAASRAPDTGASVARSAAEPGAPEAGESAARGAPGAPADRAEPASDAQTIARRVLDALAARKGVAMADARARGRLLSEFGPDVVAAFEEYRKESGGTENPAPFREALRERWGIDLGPPRARS